MFHLSHSFLTVTVKVELIRIFNTKEREGLLLKLFKKRRKDMQLKELIPKPGDKNCQPLCVKGLFFFLNK